MPNSHDPEAPDPSHSGDLTGKTTPPVAGFPSGRTTHYAYTSGTTRILRENFAELEAEATPLLGLKKDDLVVDIGSNDGTLLANFQKAGNRVVGIEPTDVGKTANARGIPTITAFFDSAAVDEVLAKYGRAKVVTATNVFAHIEGIHAIVDALLRLLGDDGVFISESHYWVGLMETLQYDTIYHEHLRYYSLTSLRNLLAMHGLEVFHARPIPTHGGSIRVYAARKGKRAVQPSVAAYLSAERQALTPSRLDAFSRGVVASKLKLYRLLDDVSGKGARIYGIEKERVLLDNDGSNEYIDNSAAAPPNLGVTPIPVPGGVPQASGGGEGVKQLSENQYVVARSEINNALTNLSDLATKARIVPSFKNGVANGFKLFSIVPDSLYAKIGVQNGDVIRRITGYEMNSPDKALEIYQKLRDASRIEIEIERRGETLRKTYSIE